MITILKRLLFTPRGLTALLTWFALFLLFSYTVYSILGIVDSIPNKSFYSDMISSVLIILFIYKNIGIFSMKVPGQEIWVTSNSLIKSSNPQDCLKAYPSGFTFVYIWETEYRKVNLVRDDLKICSNREGSHPVFTSKDGAAITAEWTSIMYPDASRVLTYVLHTPESIRERVTGIINQTLSDKIGKKEEQWIIANKKKLITDVAKIFGGETTISSTEDQYGVKIMNPVLANVDISPEIRKARADIAQLKNESEEAKKIMEDSKNSLTYAQAMEIVSTKRGNVTVSKTIISGLENATNVVLGPNVLDLKKK